MKSPSTCCSPAYSSRTLHSMASFLQLSLLLTCLFFLPISYHIHAEQQHHHLIITESLLDSTRCSSSASAPVSTAAGLGSTVQVFHRRCSPAGNRKNALDHATLLRRDHSRVQSIHRHLAEWDAATPVPARLGLPFDSLEYVVTIGMGTPKQNFTVLFDTGSDLTWIQCEPCMGPCRPQDEPLFDSSQSSSYTDIPCSSTDCSQSALHTLCPQSLCLYSVKYADRSVSVGYLAHETATLSTSPEEVLDGFLFGCSRASTDLFGEVAGLLGLGQGATSIVSQTRSKYNGVFSYCLPPFGSSTGYLTFGAAPPQPNIQFTPLQPNQQAPTFYFVQLTGIAVNGSWLPISPDVFSAGTIIDSGTVITRLPPGAYVALRDEFRRHMSGKYPVAPSLDFLDTCYNLTGHEKVLVPKVVLGFGGGARINVDASGILYVANIWQACLAFAAIDVTGTGGTSIVGNMQQRAYSMVFDSAGGRIGFGANGCS